MKKIMIPLLSFFAIGLIASGLAAYLLPQEMQLLTGGLLGFAYFISLHPLHRPSPPALVLLLLCLTIGLVAYLGLYQLYWFGPIGHGLANLAIAGILVMLYTRTKYGYFLLFAFLLGLVSYLPVLAANVHLGFPKSLFPVAADLQKWSDFIFWWGMINGPLLVYLFGWTTQEKSS